MTNHLHPQSCGLEGLGFLQQQQQQQRPRFPAAPQKIPARAISTIEPGVTSNTHGDEPDLSLAAAASLAAFSSEQAVTEERVRLSVDMAVPSGVSSFPLTLG